MEVLYLKDFTGYWLFFCNPKKWNIDVFLESGTIYDTFTVRDWHKDQFTKGQLGLVRVGHDHRTKDQLNGRERLERGIYAVVEVLREAELKEETVPDYWNDEDLGGKRYRVDIKCLNNLLGRPILISDLKTDSYSYDSHLIDGFQSSTMPLEAESFNRIIEKIGGLNLDFTGENHETEEDIFELEKKYRQAVPEVKTRVSKYIERGKIAQQFKKKTDFKCQICNELGDDPYVFEKENGEYYIETHHIDAISNLNEGSLGIRNLITVCPNHHRQLHYGKVDILENNKNELKIRIDDEELIIYKVK